MEVSKLTVSTETLANNTLTHSKKRKLREEAIMALIESKPNGKGITLAEFGHVAHLNGSSSVWQFLNRMVKSGMITKESIPGSRKCYYTTTRTVNTVKPKVEKISELELAPSPENVFTEKAEMNVKLFIKKAKVFAWEHNSDSLRDFISTLQ
jgi:DNA-binding transcriptional regulator GbsR (MarR family)